jgi:hypothetical protein
MACNYDESATDAETCIYASDVNLCASCSGEIDGTGIVIDTIYTYFESVPLNTININNDNKCFSSNDVGVISALIDINDFNISSPLNIGDQRWVGGKLLSWSMIGGVVDEDGNIHKITRLPDNIEQLSNLYSLYLEKNNITVLPSSFINLSNLKILFISSNGLTGLPDNIGDLLELNYLDLGYNKLTLIPESIGNLLNIVHLFLFNNQLTSLPNSICNLPLEWDDVDANNVPYFAIGGNKLCESELIPECVATSSNLNISLEQDYYSFLIDAPQDCIIGCQDETACNYHEDANSPGECIYLSDLGTCDTCSGETDGTGILLDNDGDEDGVCDVNDLCPDTILDVEVDSDGCSSDQLSLYADLIPSEYDIHNMYPNPFNPVITITYGMPENNIVMIIVYDILGRQITTLFNDYQMAGYHSIRWDGESYPSGIYFITMISGVFSQTQKILLVK